MTAPRAGGAVSRPRLVVALAVAVALAAGGCHGSSHPRVEPGSTAATTSPTVVATSTRASRAADRAVARRAVLQRADVPRGWRRVAVDGQSGDALLARLCPSVGRARRRLATLEGGALPDASSAFTPGAGGLPLVRARVYVLSTASIANKLFVLTAKASHARCVARAFAKTSGSGGSAVTYGTPTVSPIGVPRAGSAATAFEVRFATTSSGASYETRLYLVTILRDRSVVVMLFADADLLPLAASARDAIVRAAAVRDRQAGKI